MTVIYQLKSHDDLGWGNFFTSFREEYQSQCNLGETDDITVFVNDKASAYNVQIINWDTAMLEFKSERDYLMFIMRWA